MPTAGHSPESAIAVAEIPTPAVARPSAPWQGCGSVSANWQRCRRLLYCSCRGDNSETGQQLLRREERLNLRIKPMTAGSTSFYLGIYGDDWVSGEKLHDGLYTAFAEAGLDVMCSTIGAPGATSKKVLQNIKGLLNWHTARHREDKIMILLQGGRNDAIGYFGSEMYAKNMAEMVRIVLHAGFNPVVMTIPKFDRWKRKRPFLTKAHWALRQFLTGDSNDSSEEYNRAMRREILKVDSSIAIIETSVLIGGLKFDDGGHLRPEDRTVFAYRLGLQLVQKLLSLEEEPLRQ